MYSKNINNLFNIFVKKIYFQSEYIVLLIAYVNSKVKSNFERKYKTFYLVTFLFLLPFFLVLKSYSTNDVLMF